MVSNDKDMMQLVGKNVRTLRTGSGGAKADIIVDEKKVEEILGVPPEQVVDYMALLGDNIDNIPGAKGIGEKGAAELIKKYGSVEKALDHAEEVPNKRYREALQQQREQVMMSKQLATIATNLPLQLDLHALERRDPDVAALGALYRELGFNSLLKELSAEGLASSAPASAEPGVKADYAAFADAADFRAYLGKLPAKQSLAIWLNLELGERESEGFGTRIASIEVSSKAGEGRSVWLDEKGGALKVTCAASRGFETRENRSRSETCFSYSPGARSNIKHATQLYSYLLRPTTANHNFADVVLRQFNVMLGGEPGSARIICSGLRRFCARRSKSKGSRESTRKLICRLRPCWPTWNASACASTRKNWTRCRSRWRTKSGAWKKRFGISPGMNSTSIRRRSLRRFCSTR